MQRLIKYLKLPYADKILFLEAAVWLSFVRAAILWVPFRHVAPFLGRHMACTPEEVQGIETLELIRLVRRAVQTMSRHLPWECTCLVQAVTGKVILKRRGLSSTLYLGVANNDEQGLHAHAWLRSGDFVLLGHRGIERFSVVSTFA